MKRNTIVCYMLLAGFLIGIHDGRIAIWQGEDPKPVTVLPYPAELLPETDRIALEKGIHLDTREDLIRFMEDYCS